ncbi:MAG: hypothetical protein KJ922_03505, partial [Nanoarchaeota archaeon]|nr:hypothetical protein [Nanoarchaeota archaeon]
DSNLLDFCTNPLLLSFVTRLYERAFLQHRPFNVTNIAHLYRQIVEEEFADREKIDKNRKLSQDALDVMAEIGFQLHTDPQLADTPANEAKILENLRQSYGEYLSEVLPVVMGSNLVTFTNSRIQFMHRTLQEYFAARHIAKEVREGHITTQQVWEDYVSFREPATRWFSTQLIDGPNRGLLPAWDQTMIFLSGLLQPRELDALIETMLEPYFAMHQNNGFAEVFMGISYSHPEAYNPFNSNFFMACDMLTHSAPTKPYAQREAICKKIIDELNRIRFTENKPGTNDPARRKVGLFQAMGYNPKVVSFIYGHKSVLGLPSNEDRKFDEPEVIDNFIYQVGNDANTLAKIMYETAHTARFGSPEHVSSVMDSLLFLDIDKDHPCYAALQARHDKESEKRREKSIFDISIHTTTVKKPEPTTVEPTYIQKKEALTKAIEQGNQNIEAEVIAVTRTDQPDRFDFLYQSCHTDPAYLTKAVEVAMKSASHAESRSFIRRALPESGELIFQIEDKLAYWFTDEPIFEGEAFVARHINNLRDVWWAAVAPSSQDPRLAKIVLDAMNAEDFNESDLHHIVTWDSVSAYKALVDYIKADGKYASSVLYRFEDQNNLASLEARTNSGLPDVLVNLSQMENNCFGHICKLLSRFDDERLVDKAKSYIKEANEYFKHHYARTSDKFSDTSRVADYLGQVCRRRRERGRSVDPEIYPLVVEAMTRYAHLQKFAGTLSAIDPERFIHDALQWLPQNYAAKNPNYGYRSSGTFHEALGATHAGLKPQGLIPPERLI